MTIKKEKELINKINELVDAVNTLKAIISEQDLLIKTLSKIILKETI